MAENTRLKVSCEGIPLGRSRNERRNSSFSRAYCSISF